MAQDARRFDDDSQLMFNRKQVPERIFFVHGNTDDCYHTQNFAYNRFDRLLESHLMRLGYEMVVFYNSHIGVYVLNDQSRRRFTGFYKETVEKRRKAKREREEYEASEEPRVKYNDALISDLDEQEAAIAPQEQEPEAAKEPEDKEDNVYTWNPEGAALATLLDGLMHCTEFRVGVVMTDGWALFDPDNSRDDAGKLLASRLRSWYSLPAENPNIAIIVFGSMGMESIRHYLEKSNAWSPLANKIIDGYDYTKAVHYIGPPRMDEIRNVLRDRSPEYQRTYDPARRGRIEAAAMSYIIQNNGRLKSLMLLLDVKGDHFIESLHEYMEGDEDELKVMDRTKGWEAASRVLHRIVAMAGQDKRREEPLPDLSGTVLRMTQYSSRSGANISLGIVLKGRPGTGKTTIARKIGSIFRRYGLLEGGNLIEVARDRLVGQYVGETAIKTRNVINSGLGNVLFIDEAYSLTRSREAANSNDFGIEAVDTLVQAMTQHIGEICVVLAGYPDEMEQMLQANPGLPSRFEHVITIEDYDAMLLEDIFLGAIKKGGANGGEPGSYRVTETLLASPDAETPSVLDAYFYNWHAARDRRTFGNARAAEGLANEVMRMCAGRNAEKNSLMRMDSMEIVREDFPGHETLFVLRKPTLHTVDKGLEEIHGMERIKQRLREMAVQAQGEQQRMKLAEKMGKSSGGGVAPGHYLFAGDPGVGKTLISIKMAEILSALKIVDKYEPMRLTGSQLVQQMQTHGVRGVRETIEKAVGGVLVIDEAHQLLGTPYILQQLLDPMLEHRQELCVIFCCYRNEVQALLHADAGLASRIRDLYEFDNYTAEELFSIMEIMRRRKDLQYENEGDARARLCAYFQVCIDRARDSASFSENARWAEKALDDITVCMNLRLHRESVPANADDTATSAYRRISSIAMADIDEMVRRSEAQWMIR